MRRATRTAACRSSNVLVVDGRFDAVIDWGDLDRLLEGP
jgi:hypothetical protein